VFFSTHDVPRERTALDFLLHIGRAALLAMSDDFARFNAAADADAFACADPEEVG
jgi:hypothetical protein